MFSNIAFYAKPFSKWFKYNEPHLAKEKFFITCNSLNSVCLTKNYLRKLLWRIMKNTDINFCLF